MELRIRLDPATRKSVLARLHQAYARGPLRLVRRIHALLGLVDGQSIAEVAESLQLGEQTVRDYLHAFLHQGVESLLYQRPSGCPPKLTKSQRKELTQLILQGPEAAGYATACWSAVLLQDLIQRRFGVAYHPHYVCALLGRMGFSFQKAHFVSDHLDVQARQQWREQTWPAILQLAQQKQALILFADEASFAQWGSLSYTWAPQGQQPCVRTSGKRKGYKVFGLIEYFSGHLFYRGHTGRFNSESYRAFLQEVLEQTGQHLIVIQDGAKYHTSKAMRTFFAQHQERLTVVQLPSYSPDFNPIEFLWKKVKKQATHLRYFPAFTTLVQKVDEALLHFANLPNEVLALMAHYCESLGTATA